MIHHYANRRMARLPASLVVLAALFREIAAQEDAVFECPPDKPEGGWKEGDAQTNFCCKSISWGDSKHVKKCAYSNTFLKRLQTIC